MRAISPKCAWLIGLIIPFARYENKKHQKKRIHNIFLPLAPVPSNVKVRMSGLRVPARGRLHAGHSVRYPPQISPPTCVPSAHSCSRRQWSHISPAHTQLLTLGCQADPGHW